MNKKIFVLQFRTDQSEAHDQLCLNQALEGMNVSFVYFNPTRNEMPENLDNQNDAYLMQSLFY